MISQVVLAALAVIESFLPLLGTSSATTTLVTTIINALTTLLPFIINEVSTVYTATKNIITRLQASGDPTPAELAALAALDAQVEAAWAMVAPQIDPDNPANAGTPAGEDPSTT